MTARPAHSIAAIPIRTERASSRIPEPDLLRFVAAIAVVFFHYAFRGYAADNLITMHYLPL